MPARQSLAQAGELPVLPALLSQLPANRVHDCLNLLDRVHRTQPIASLRSAMVTISVIGSSGEGSKPSCR